jgi:hypothetical protein
MKAVLKVIHNREGARRTGSNFSPYLINPASRGSVRLISGMQMISNSPANSANMYGT